MNDLDMSLPSYVERFLGEVAANEGQLQADSIRLVICSEFKNWAAVKSLPAYAEPGSYGPLFNGLQEFLVSYWRKESTRDDLPQRLAIDGFLLGPTVQLLVAYQLRRGIAADAGFGPETRRCTKEDGFDFEAYAMNQLPGGEPTYLVQPPGERGIELLRWTPGVGTEKNFEMPWHE